MNKPASLFVIIAAMPVVAGCGHAAKPSATISTGGDTASRLSTRNGSVIAEWLIKTSNITLTMPVEPRQLDPCPISVTANYPDGSTMKGARVSVALTMPSMPMPVNQIALKETSPGVFSGSCRFTMAGVWKVRVLLNSPEYSRSDRWVQVTVH